MYLVNEKHATSCFTKLLFDRFFRVTEKLA
jgi:hypothetical protein